MSGLRSSDETDEDEGSITRLRFVWFTSNFVHLHPRKPLENRVCHAYNLLQNLYPKILSDKTRRDPAEMMHDKGLQEDDIQKFHTTVPEQLTDQELLLSTISAPDLVRKHSDGWDKDHPKCLFCDKRYRFRPWTFQCHMTSQTTGSGKHKRESAVCSMESTKDDSPLKARFFALRKEIYNRYIVKQQTNPEVCLFIMNRWSES